jgi:hypothetical protein
MNTDPAKRRELHHAEGSPLLASGLGGGRWCRINGRSDHISPGQTKTMKSALVS